MKEFLQAQAAARGRKVLKTDCLRTPSSERIIVERMTQTGGLRMRRPAPVLWKIIVTASSELLVLPVKALSESSG
jgi:hypothetical protein